MINFLDYILPRSNRVFAADSEKHHGKLSIFPSNSTEEDLQPKKARIEVTGRITWTLMGKDIVRL
jgi:hypothetical protein